MSAEVRNVVITRAGADWDYSCDLRFVGQDTYGFASATVNQNSYRRWAQQLEGCPNAEASAFTLNIAATAPCTGRVTLADLDAPPQPPRTLTEPLPDPAGPCLGREFDPCWMLNVGGQQMRAGNDGRFVLGNLSTSDADGDGFGDPLQVLAQCVAGGRTLYATSEVFSIEQGRACVLGDFTFREMPPQGLVSLQHSGATEVAFAESAPLTTTGVQSDGTTRDLSGDPMTVYHSSNPEILTVHADGTMTGVNLGRAFVTARNSGVSAVTEIEVTDAMNPPTRVTGRVLFADGSSAANAQVILLGRDGEGTTAVNGVFSIGDIPFTCRPQSRRTLEGPL